MQTLSSTYVSNLTLNSYNDISEGVSVVRFEVSAGVSVGREPARACWRGCSAVAECNHNICFYDSTEFGFSK